MLLVLPPITPPHLGTPDALNPWFDASFDFRMWGSGAAHGMSFCYGELSHTPGGVFNESLTEMGVQYDGLCDTNLKESHSTFHD